MQSTCIPFINYYPTKSNWLRLHGNTVVRDEIILPKYRKHYALSVNHQYAYRTHNSINKFYLQRYNKKNGNAIKLTIKCILYHEELFSLTLTATP